MSSFDHFIAALRCPNCGKISPEDTSTNMQTRIQVHPSNRYLRVGDTVDMIDPETAGYLLVRKPLPSEPIHILEVWECPWCGQAFNWAEVVVRDDVIVSITAVEFNRGTLGRTNYISDQLRYIFEYITGKSLYNGRDVRTDFIQLLKEHLPD